MENEEYMLLDENGEVIDRFKDVNSLYEFVKEKTEEGKNKDKRTGRSLFSIVRIKAKINNMNEWFMIDTGFSGEVNYEIFDRIPEIDAGEICISEGECYRRFGKISSYVLAIERLT